MKNMKKCFSILLALVMVFALAATAMAENTASITIADGMSDHSFTAYQIFAGTLVSGKLGIDSWGDGIDGAALLTDLKSTNAPDAFMVSEEGTKTNAFKDCTTAADVAGVLGTVGDDSAMAKAFAKLAHAHRTGSGTSLSGTVDSEGKVTVSMPVGYYLIVDTTSFADNAENAVYNASLLQVVGDVEVKVKTDKPSVEKKVQENVKNLTTKDSKDNVYGDKYNDVADYNIGDAVPFKLIGKVPDMTYYDTYKYIFHDSMDTGLTPPAKNDIKVYVSDDQEGSGKTDITSNFTITVSGQNITVSSDDIKAISGVEKDKYIIVEYSATLNSGAEIGLPGNVNKVYLEYSNNPSQEGTGKTPEDKVVVFTFEMDVTKVDGATVGDDKELVKLAGAKFVLWNKDQNKVAVLDSNKVTGWQAPTTADGVTTYPANSELTSAENTGLFKVIGLDDGEYYLEETKAPEGYNLLTEKVKVVVKATTANDQSWTGENANTALTELKVNVDDATKDANGDTQSGVVEVTVENNQGSTLPETGGMGTTILYIAGGVLVAAAAVMLIVKRRMAVDK